MPAASPELWSRDEPGIAVLVRGPAAGALTLYLVDPTASRIVHVHPDTERGAPALARFIDDWCRHQRACATAVVDIAPGAASPGTPAPSSPSVEQPDLSCVNANCSPDSSRSPVPTGGNPRGLPDLVLAAANWTAVNTLGMQATVNIRPDMLADTLSRITEQGKP